MGINVNKWLKGVLIIMFSYGYLEYYKKNKYFRLIAIVTILLLVFLVGAIVYLSGGTTAAVHLMYIPILLTVFIFGIKEAIITSVVAGLILGPYMPMVVSERIMQNPRSWIFRIIMFILIVFVVGILLDSIKKYYDLEKVRAYQDIKTGYPNYNKFKDDISEMIIDGKNEMFSLILFEFKNKEMISHYVNDETSHKAYLNIIKKAENFFKGCKIYTISNSDKFIVYLPNMDSMATYEQANEFFDLTKEPMYIETLPISVVVKGGIVSYPDHCNNIYDIILTLEKALSQVSRSHQHISIYDRAVEEERAKYYDTLVSIYHSLQNDAFSLVFQPKIRLSSNEMIGVEALLRIKGNDYQGLSIQQLISIAEDVGFIHEITKWVILNTIKQIKLWKDKGLDIKVSINLSPIDLNDCSIIEYTVNLLKEYELSSKNLEFEITERTIFEDEEKVIATLNELKNQGISIALDDYGTGHNSLVYLVNSSFPFNHIKIDKAFIDNIHEEQNKHLISGIIETAHSLNIEVIAEGVETEDQMLILREIGCDVIQGYYYSKPLSPEKFLENITLFS